MVIGDRLDLIKYSRAILLKFYSLQFSSPAVYLKTDMKQERVRQLDVQYLHKEFYHGKKKERRSG